MVPGAHSTGGSSVRPLRVLVVDDEPEQALPICHAIEALGHHVRYAPDGAEGLRSFRDEPFDVIITDWLMPGLDGLALTEQIRIATHEGRYVYVVLVSGVIDHENEIAALVGGADEVMSKPLDLDELGARLTVAERITEAHRRLANQNRVLRRETHRALAAAAHDPLTGAYNRRRLDSDLAELCQSGQTAVLAMLDIDDFKLYNDSMGHIAGDLVLQRVVDTARSTLRRGDDLYRYGGEEFVALLRGTDTGAARKAAERLGAAIKQMAIPHPSSVRGMVTASIGLALGPRESPAIWIAEADEALYTAKRNGKDRTELAPGRAVTSKPAGPG